jgi:hypothetical protein
MRAKDAMTSPPITVTPDTHCKDAAADGVVELGGDGDRQTMRLAEILARSVPGVLDVRLVPGTG